MCSYLTPKQQMDIMNLHRGQKATKAERALETMEAFQASKATKALQLRLNIVGLVVSTT